MGVVKYSKDSEAMKRFIDQYCNTFTVSPEIAYITGVVTNTKWLEEWERKARTAGRVEGKAEGRVEGKTEGINEERTRNVLSMYGKGVSAEDISHLCNIPYEEVRILFLHQDRSFKVTIMVTFTVF